MLLIGAYRRRSDPAVDSAGSYARSRADCQRMRAFRRRIVSNRPRNSRRFRARARRPPRAGSR